MRAFSFDTLALAVRALDSNRVSVSLISPSLSEMSVGTAPPISTSLSRLFLYSFWFSISKLTFFSSSSTSIVVSVWLLATMARILSVFSSMSILLITCSSTAASNFSALGLGVSQHGHIPLRLPLQL